METALMSGVGASDWSWSALFADYNQDGEQDLFISNGIPKRPNNLDYIKFVSSDQIQNKISATKLVDQEALQLMPSGSVTNYIYKGGSDLIFENKSSTWIEQTPTTSTATAMGDLDNDVVTPHYKLTTRATNRQGDAKTSIWLLRPWGDL